MEATTTEIEALRDEVRRLHAAYEQLLRRVAALDGLPLPAWPVRNEPDAGT